jgi:hypothetical protein
MSIMGRAWKNARIICASVRASLAAARLELADQNNSYSFMMPSRCRTAHERRRGFQWSREFGRIHHLASDAGLDALEARRDPFLDARDIAQVGTGKVWWPGS